MTSTQQKYLKAVDDISFKISKGEVFALVGESGSGKSTTGRLLLKLLKPSDGSIDFMDKDVVRLHRRERKWFHRNIQMIFQDPYQSLNPRFKVLQSIVEPLLVHGVRDQNEQLEKASSALKLARLTPPENFFDKFPHQLSGGQLQRVSIARSLILDPAFIVADEPVSMLDVSVRAGVLNVLKETTQQMNLALLYISHDLATVNYLANKTAIMYLGAIVERGNTAQVIGNPLHPYTQALVAAIPSRKAKRQVMSIGKEPADPTNIVKGCRFAPRCPKVMEHCWSQAPKHVEIDLGREVACHLYG